MASALKIHLTRPQVFLWRMIVFLLLVLLLCIILAAQSEQIATSFMANPGLNGLIVGVLLVGALYIFRNVLRLYPEIGWVNDFRVAEPGHASDERTPVLLAPMATMLRDRRGQLTLSTTATRSLLESLASRLDEGRETSRYLVGLLVFLGLLGTFWGLLDTVRSVGGTIDTLDTGNGEGVILFQQLKEGLSGPLKGMGTAFSSSLFGLAGSLILGFLDLQAGQAQNRFYNEVEDWLAAMTELQGADVPAGSGASPQLRFALLDMQRSISDLGERMEARTLEDNSTEAVKDLALGVEKLIRQMRAEQKVVREWADEQAQQQQELATVLRNISETAKLPLREDRRR